MYASRIYMKEKNYCAFKLILLYYIMLYYIISFIDILRYVEYDDEDGGLSVWIEFSLSFHYLDSFLIFLKFT